MRDLSDLSDEENKRLDQKTKLFRERVGRTPGVNNCIIKRLTHIFGEPDSDCKDESINNSDFEKRKPLKRRNYDR